MEVSTDLSVLMTEKEWNEILEGMPEQLAANGFEPANISAEVGTSGTDKPRHSRGLV